MAVCRMMTMCLLGKWQWIARLVCFRVMLACLLSVAWLGTGSSADGAPKSAPEPLHVAKVWSGHPVGFFLLTRSNMQYVAFYDENRDMTVASRRLNSANWTFTRLPEQVGWDSHNYITMAMDSEGHLHLSGNMHGNPLVYFRSSKPLDAATLERVPSMVGSDEARTTYPVFMEGPAGKLVFTYRSGSSGNGNQFYNVYETATKTWRRLLDQPLLDGAGQKNAYLHGPVRGPDGIMHLGYIWRETPDCETSHYVCYARSRDWVSWETAGGKPLKLPITFETGETVDPVPMNGGAINGNVILGFDALNRPIVSYHKFDTNGFTQVYNARFENGAWQIRQATDWKYRWEFGGRGSIIFEVNVGSVQLQPDGSLTQRLTHSKYGSTTIRLDPDTLAPLGRVTPKKTSPARPSRVESTFPGMEARQRGGIGDRSPGGSQYILRWESLPANRDRPRKGPLPPPSWLVVWESEG
jgi:hypothetical protein